MAIPTGQSIRPHARAVNSKYQNGSSNYVSLKDRWNETLASMPVSDRHAVISRLKLALALFQQRYPDVDSFDHPDFRLCEAIPRRLSRGLVDTTIQRHLKVDWVIDIVKDFVVYQAQPIQVYNVPAQDVPSGYHNHDDYYASWDGQHTAIAFWIIATMIFKQDPDDVQIPTVRYDMRNRLECRITFLKNNSKEGKDLLTPIDLVTQKIMAVRLDGVKDPAWTQIEQKQQYLEAVDLFLTDKKFHDDDQAGAITRPGDIAHQDVPVEVVRQFAVYANRVLEAYPRPINTKELPVILHFLKMANGMEYTDSEIESLADLCMTLFDADFDENGRFWDRVGSAYTKWHIKHHADIEESLRPAPKLNKDVPQGGTFFWHQLGKSWKDANGNPMRLPRLNISTSFNPAKKDLF
jgi:hypothetical protein